MKLTNKILIGVCSFFISIFVMFTFFIKIPVYDNCSIVNNDQENILFIDSDTYNKISNKENLILKNKEMKIKLRINEEWIWDYELKIWSVPIDTTSNLEFGNYLIYLKDRYIFDIRI
ncbi:MAG: hypothetical protein ACRC4L_02905 [Mycoplasma sp.]